MTRGTQRIGAALVAAVVAIAPRAGLAAPYGALDSTGVCHVIATNLQDAVNVANVVSIWVEGANTETQQTTIDKSISINGVVDHSLCDASIQAAASISTATSNRLLLIDDTSAITVEVNGVDLAGGTTAADGGTIYLGDAVTLRIDGEATVSGGQAQGSGGCIYGEDALLLMEDGTDVTDCAAGVNGGGVALIGTHPSITTVQNVVRDVTDCDAGADGGGLWGEDTAVCLFGASDNRAGDQGGGAAFYSDDADLQLFVMDAILTNEATGQGGGIYVSGPNSHARVADTIVNMNTSFDDGGGIAASNAATVHLAGGLTLFGNDGRSHGGGIYADQLSSVVAPDIYAEGCYIAQEGAITINENRAGVTGGIGGGIYVDDASFDYGSQADLEVFDNQAWADGGGIAAVNGGSVQLDRATVRTNESLGKGGGIFADGASTEVVMVGRVLRNRGPAQGGGAYVGNGALLSLAASIVEDNDSFSGGGIKVEDGVLEVLAGTIVTGSLNSAGITADGGTVTVEESAVSSNTRSGMHLHSGADATLRNASVSDNTKRGLVISGSTTQVTFEQPSPCTYPCNEVSDNGDEGVRLSGATLDMYGVRLRGNGLDGIRMFSGDATVTNSVVALNGDVGMELSGSAEATVHHVSLIDNTDAAMTFADNAEGDVSNTLIFSNGAASRADDNAVVALDCGRSAAFATSGSASVTTNNWTSSFTFGLAGQGGQNYRLSNVPGSVLVDRCPTGTRPDMDGNGVVNDYDVGAFEFQP